jgi:NTP pyrophosphatase (non-canonical NTP hydrolase)
MINNLAEELHNDMGKAGFWETPNIGEKLMLVVSELGECIEAHRNKQFSNWGQYASHAKVIGENPAYKLFIKDTFEDEISDAVLRLFDLAGHLGIDLERHIEAKIKFNKTREYKHGKSY